MREKNQHWKVKRAGHTIVQGFFVYVYVIECVRSQAYVSHHVLTRLSGVLRVLHLPLSDHVTRSTNDNITG